MGSIDVMAILTHMTTVAFAPGLNNGRSSGKAFLAPGAAPA
jgi:hypothetical protein